MQDDKQKIFDILASLDKDFEEGKLSPERYKYFKAKYQEKLNDLDKYEATNRIRSMQGKRTPNVNKRKRARKRKMDKKNQERNDLVQKYIVNPKKDDKELNEKKKKSIDSSTFELIVILMVVVAFTIGITVGIFALDFENMSVVNADALVVDTSFPDTSNVTLETTKSNTTTTSNYSSSSSSSYSSSYEDTYESGSSSSGGSSDSGGGSSGSGGGSTGGGGSSESGGSSSSGGGSEGI